MIFHCHLTNKKKKRQMNYIRLAQHNMTLAFLERTNHLVTQKYINKIFRIKDSETYVQKALYIGYQQLVFGPALKF